MLYSIKPFLVLLAMLLSSQVYGSATDDLREEEGAQAAVPSAPKPSIKFTNFEYNPNTQKFKGRFYDESEYILRQLVGYYVDKYYDTSEHLRKTQEKLTSLKKDFDEEKYQTLLRVKAALEKEDKTLDQENERICLELQKKFDVIAFQETKIDYLQSNLKKYTQAKEILNKIESFLQTTFFLEMFVAQKKPFFSPVTQIVLPRADFSELNISSFYIGSLNPGDSRLQTLKEASIENIDIDKWSKDGVFLCAFLRSYVEKEEDMKANKKESLKSFRNVKTQLESHKSKGILGVLLQYAMSTLTPEQLLEKMREGTITEIQGYNSRLERKVKPLADVARNFAKTLQAFQEELKTQAQTPAANQ